MERAEEARKKYMKKLRDDAFVEIAKATSPHRRSLRRRRKTSGRAEQQRSSGKNLAEERRCRGREIAACSL